MAWVRLADDFPDHPKIVAAGPLAGWLWICGIAYCNRYLTDGFLPAAQVRRLADLDDPAQLAVRLVDVGLWETASGGYRVHDYESYQPSADTVKAERTRNAERIATWRDRARSNAVSNGVTNTVTNTGSTGVSNAVSNGVRTAGVIMSRSRSRSRSINPAPEPGPGPAGTTPQPPPQAEGVHRTRGKKSRRSSDEPTGSLTPEEIQAWTLPPPAP